MYYCTAVASLLYFSCIYVCTAYIICILCMICACNTSDIQSVSVYLREGSFPVGFAALLSFVCGRTLKETFCTCQMATLLYTAAAAASAVATANRHSFLWIYICSSNSYIESEIKPRPQQQKRGNDGKNPLIFCRKKSNLTERQKHERQKHNPYRHHATCVCVCVLSFRRFWTPLSSFRVVHSTVLLSRGTYPVGRRSNTGSIYIIETEFPRLTTACCIIM